MGKPTGFMEYDRQLPKKRPPSERVKESTEFIEEYDAETLNEQAARCMDCGVPFCHSGCPLGNIIPEFNDAVYRKNWQEAAEILFSTNNFPEFTGRICPAPCEASCVLGINKPPVTIELIEKHIAEKAFELGIVKPNIPEARTGFEIAVIGSGPAGLAAAAQLNSAGHKVVVFERADKPGGLLMYGIPDFKLEKWVVQRRIDLMRQEGVAFKTNTNIGVDIAADDILNTYDAVVLCGGSTVPRDLELEGRDLEGVHFAMDYLEQQNRRVAGETIPRSVEISAKDKNVVVIGGGDTGSDCIGTANRQGAKNIYQFELMPQPPAGRSPENPWPEWPVVMRTSSSHEEGCERFWAMNTLAFQGTDGEVESLRVTEVKWQRQPDGRMSFEAIEGTESELACDLVLIAVGFKHPEKHGLLEQLGIQTDDRGNVKADGYKTSVPGVFSAGDMRRGQSLVVWAISEGREAARAVDEFLVGTSILESKDASMMQL